MCCKLLCAKYLWGRTETYQQEFPNKLGACFFKESVPYEASFGVSAGRADNDDVISVNRLLGAEDEGVETAGRYLAEKIMVKSNGRVNSVLLGISLTNYEKVIVKELTEKILAMLWIRR